MEGSLSNSSNDESLNKTGTVPSLLAPAVVGVTLRGKEFQSDEMRANRRCL